MKKQKVLGCGAGIGVALVILFVVATVAVLLEEMGVPHKLLVRFGALIALAGMALGYRVSEKIGGKKADADKGGAAERDRAERDAGAPTS